MKIFGIELFRNYNRGNQIFAEAEQQIGKLKTLPDFRENNRHFIDFEAVGEPIQWSSSTTVGPAPISAAITSDTLVEFQKEKKQEIKKEDKKTPKEIYNLQMLNDKQFKIKVDPVYIDEQLESFKTKLSLLNLRQYDMQNGSTDVRSMIIRLQNRKKYSLFTKFYDQYPYTTNTLINKVLKENNYLQIDTANRFVPDLPPEAIKAMTDYKKNTQKLCKKDPVFYMIADKEDFKKTEKRKDPILLAQSPFGHFWQILGAWDKELLLLEEL